MKDSRSYVEVDLKKLIYNLDNIYKYSKKQIYAVVKANAYGNGAVQVSKSIESKDYVVGFCVAAIQEAMELRKNGIVKSILNLGATFIDEIDEAIGNNIEMTVYNLDIAKIISNHAVSLNKQALVQIKLDTGMSRLGFPIEDDTVDKIEFISNLPNVKIVGMFTHFSKADEEDKTFTYKQLDRFLSIKHKLDKKNIKFDHYHCCNSTALFFIKSDELDIIRPGRIMYGLYPDNIDKELIDVNPILSFYSRISSVKEIPSNSLIGYGGTFISEKKMRIATVAIGYADGYPNSLSNKGYVLVHGQKARILGSVCMDQMMIDISDIDNVKFQDRVILIGCDKEYEISVRDVADLSGRNLLEFLSLISSRIPRIYI